jgi:hypothetical protein
MGCFADRALMLGNFNRRISMGRTLPCLCLEQVSYMDKLHRAGRVGESVLRGQAGDNGTAIGVGACPVCSASVFIWPGMASDRRPVVLCFPSCQNCSIKRNALGAPCLRYDFCSPPAPTRSAGMVRIGVAVDVTLAVAITEASRRQALMLPRWLAADARAGCAGARPSNAVVKTALTCGFLLP